jgi:hypothetical protein
VTQNISEGGFLFALAHPAYLPDDVALDFTLETECYRARVRGEIIFISTSGGKWQYHVRLLPHLSEEDRREYLQLVYDREPSLPKSMNTWVTAFDDIVDNANQRIDKQRAEMRTLPRIELERFVRFEEGGSATLVNFNYKYFLARNLNTDEPKLTLIPRAGVRIILEPAGIETADPGLTLLRVANWEELAHSGAFQTLLEDWIFERSQTKKKRTVSNGKRRRRRSGTCIHAVTARRICGFNGRVCRVRPRVLEDFRAGKLYLCIIAADLLDLFRRAGQPAAARRIRVVLRRGRAAGPRDRKAKNRAGVQPLVPQRAESRLCRGADCAGRLADQHKFRSLR